MTNQKILKIRRYGEEDAIFIIPEDVANETTVNLLKNFILDQGNTLPDLSEVCLVDYGDLVDLEDVEIIAGITYANVVE